MVEKKKTKLGPKSLAALRTSMVDNYGASRVVRKDEAIVYDVVPTGSAALDHALRVGGFIRGRLSEVSGPPGVCKSSLAFSSMAAAQEKFPSLAVGYIDMERTWDWSWVEKLGLNTGDSRLLYTKPNHSEDVSDQIREMMLSEAFSFIVVDSIGGMESAKAMYEKEASDSTMGRNAQIISRMCKQVATIAENTNTAVLFINQHRANFSSPTGGNINSGPKVLQYATTVSISLKRKFGEKTIKYIGEGDDKIVAARQISATVDRSKVAPQGVTTDFWFRNVDTKEEPWVGIDRVDEIGVLAVKSGVVKKNGGWRVLPDGTSTQKLSQVLRDDPALMEEIRVLALDRIAHEVTPEVRTTFEEE